MKLNKRFFALLLLPVLLISGCAKTPVNTDIIVIDSESFYSDFEVKGDSVYIYCTLSLRNCTSRDMKFQIKGCFDDDVKGHLLTERVLFAHDDALETVFFLRANEKKEFDVCFTGQYGGRPVKHDRLLPEIEIMPVSSPS